ncbi:MAG TPA: DUF5320 domain-containing protein [Bacillota bacterium]|nr:DUF5320 domain-containing protein [Bacillota bacterium]HPJ23820.1 DUF5320 domain-containing protein [Bacillota bacterium]
MPARDGTGPLGDRKTYGRRNFSCRGNGQPQIYGRGGRGYGRFVYNENDKELLKQEKELLQARIKDIDTKLND